MLVLSILLISRCLGTVSKALLMSMAAMIVRGAGLLEFRPSSVVCVMFVRREDVVLAAKAALLIVRSVNRSVDWSVCF